MNDSKFAVVVFVAYCLISAAVGCIATAIAMSGAVPCSVTVEYAGSHKVEYLTECEL